MNKRSIPQTYLKKPSGRLPSFRHHLPSPAPTARLPFLFSSSCSSLSSHHVLLPQLPKKKLSLDLTLSLSSLASHYLPYCSFPQQAWCLWPPAWLSMSLAVSDAASSCMEVPPFKCHPPDASQVAGRLNINAYIYKKKQSQRGGLQICPSSVEFTSAKNMNTEVKRKCE